jgi:hypothetical protein
VIFSAVLDDAVSDVLDYDREFVASDVWMGVDEN